MQCCRTCDKCSKSGTFWSFVSFLCFYIFLDVHSYQMKFISCQFVLIHSLNLPQSDGFFVNINFPLATKFDIDWLTHADVPVKIYVPCWTHGMMDALIKIRIVVLCYATLGSKKFPVSISQNVRCYFRVHACININFRMSLCVIWCGHWSIHLKNTSSRWLFNTLLSMMYINII